jgi:selenocysteine lyase/cysteine desulfurase
MAPTAATVRRLRNQGIMASETPYAVRHARFTPCMYNTAEEIDQALEAVAAMG